MQTTLRALALAGVLAGGIGAADAAGVLAIGSCGAYGFAYDYGQQEAAHKAALAKCEGKCQPVPFRKGCAAFAIDGRNVCGAHGFAVSGRLGDAQNTALRHCYKYGGKDCMIRAWVCDAKG